MLFDSLVELFVAQQLSDRAGHEPDLAKLVGKRGKFSVSKKNRAGVTSPDKDDQTWGRLAGLLRFISFCHGFRIDTIFLPRTFFLPAIMTHWVFNAES